MHIGGLRTALFSYLLAKKTKGQFLLRIEDTDQKRLVPDAEAQLCEDLQKAGLQWDEGPLVGGPYGPYKQSERTDFYRQHAKHLLDSEAAYRCFCTPQTSGSAGGKAAYVTSGCYQDCSSLPLEEAQDRAQGRNEAFTVRLKQPGNVHKRVYKDLIYGKIQPLKRSPSASPDSEDDSGIDAADTILIKSDGTPTYHFANVVDDHSMGITHVIRGTEWMASTPLHYDLYSAFGWEPPAFAHVGLLVDETKAKLSKRSNTGLVLDVKSMREEQGILPEVLNNFLALLGWSNPGRSDVLEMKDLVRSFDLKFTKGNTVVMMDKLWYLQKRHIALKCERAQASNSTEPIQNVVSQIREEVERQLSGSIKQRFPTQLDLEAYCAEILLADSKAYRTPREYVERNRYFFDHDPSQMTHSDSFSDGAASMAYAAITKKILESFDFNQPYREPAVATCRTTKPASEIERISSRIHAAIHHSIWRALANPMWLMLPEERYAEAAAKGQVPPPGQELEYVPFTDQSLDKEAMAKLLGDKSSNPQLTIAGTEETVKAYNEWNKGMMRYLRERLSYGLPGPGIGVVMAILGYEECCKRLGAVAQEKGGWRRNGSVSP
ncbi:Glutamate--tRNA ligase [Lecanosticta acicola]|uniref:glutamate--tRNA ligase n=1 Tax=Lecanosticta acicola TaxID=111012 RepID=A0AAI8YXF1_9PEZI|nr:Glutamate--tRNA ligase [Lecanosticta acicola]